MAAVGNRVVEETFGQVDVQAGAVAGLAIGIDRAPVPDRLQRINRRRDNPPGRLAIGGSDEADAAGIRFEFRPVHAFAREAFMFGGGKCVGH